VYLMLYWIKMGLWTKVFDWILASSFLVLRIIGVGLERRTRNMRNTVLEIWLGSMVLNLAFSGQQSDMARKT
jgi:hypothetical protein